MDRRERYRNEEETLRVLFQAERARIWTALPCVVIKFDVAKMTVDAQPTINARARNGDGTQYSIQLPQLLDCPVLWTGGGVTLTYPIAPGDECLVIFSSRCIDTWWNSGYSSPAGDTDNSLNDPPTLRMHNLSDGFALVGVRSLPRAFSVSTSAAQLRTDDGSAYIELNPTSKNIKAHTSGDAIVEANGNINATAGGNITMQGATITLKGNIVLDGPISQANSAGGSSSSSLIGPLAVTNDVTAAGKSTSTHHHTEHDGPSTSAPV